MSLWIHDHYEASYFWGEQTLGKPSRVPFCSLGMLEFGDTERKGELEQHPVYILPVSSISFAVHKVSALNGYIFFSFLFLA